MLYADWISRKSYHTNELLEMFWRALWSRFTDKLALSSSVSQKGKCTIFSAEYKKKCHKCAQTFGLLWACALQSDWFARVLSLTLIDMFLFLISTGSNMALLSHWIPNEWCHFGQYVYSFQWEIVGLLKWRAEMRWHRNLSRNIMRWHTKSENKNRTWKSIGCLKPMSENVTLQ